MKLAVPAVQGESLEGEKTPDYPVFVETRVPNPRVPVAMSLHLDHAPDDRNHDLASHRVRNYYKEGYFTRAIVTGKTASTLNDLKAQADPNNWGTVVAFHAYQKWPLEVVWNDGQRSYHDKETLVLIYPGCSESDMRAHLLSMHTTRKQ